MQIGNIYGVRREAKRHAAFGLLPRAAHRIRRAYGKAVSPLGSASPFQMRLVSSQTTSHAGTMREKSPPWPHAPMHRLSQTGTYFVTSATNQKAHLPDEFDVSPER